MRLRLGNHLFKHGGMKICLLLYFHTLRKAGLTLLSINSLQKSMMLYANISAESPSIHCNLSNVYIHKNWNGF